MISFMKSDWSEEAINEQITLFGVLVLFEIVETLFGKEAQMIICGNLNSWDKSILKETITSKFGGQPLSTTMCVKINDYAEKWYNHRILRRKARVINKTKELT